MNNRVRLLVVDEEPGYFGELCEWAEICSHQYKIECQFADSKQRVDELLKTWAPSVVMLDLHIPDLPCFDILNGCLGHAIPVIATGRAISPELEHSALARGAIAYLPKTSDPEELERILHFVANVSELGSCCN